MSILAGVGRGRARGWPTEVEGDVERLRARGIEARDGESWPAQCQRWGSARLELEEEEEKAPWEVGIRSCARDKAERGVEGEDRRHATRGVVGAGSRYGRRGTVEHNDEFE